MERPTLKEQPDEKPSVSFFSSGCRTVDCALGGGYAEGRIANIIGDTSTGKTQMAIEAAANFRDKHPKALIRYRETESAWDEEFAQNQGLPSSHIELNPVFKYTKVTPGTASTKEKKEEVICGPLIDTVEDLDYDWADFIKKVEASGAGAGLYILDSLDALSDESEMARGFGEKSYGVQKAKDMSKIFRLKVRALEDANITVIIISQIRDNIGVTFGRTWTRSGGRALDFYSTHILVISAHGPIEKTRDTIKRRVGTKARIKVIKSKVDLAFYEVEFNIMFMYGIDDLRSSCEWLDEVKRLGDIGVESKEKIPNYLKVTNTLPYDEFLLERKRVDKIVDAVWHEIEAKFMPDRRKYGDT